MLRVDVFASSTSIPLIPTTVASQAIRRVQGNGYSNSLPIPERRKIFASHHSMYTGRVGPAGLPMISQRLSALEGC